MLFLGGLYLVGHGVEEGKDKGASMIKNALDLGNTNAICLFGEHLMKGEIMEKDLE